MEKAAGNASPRATQLELGIVARGPSGLLYPWRGQTAARRGLENTEVLRTLQH